MILGNKGSFSHPITVCASTCQAEKAEQSWGLLPVILPCNQAEKCCQQFRGKELHLRLVIGAPGQLPSTVRAAPAQAQGASVLSSCS